MDVEAVEPRPCLHVTPPSGWLNDPVGGIVHGGRQHLFFQYVPSSTQWRLDCHWGHLAGDDLVRWRHLPVALAPGDGDDGVWSGSAVVDQDGPVVLYTSVVDGSLDLGRIALARPLDDGLVRWRKHVGNPVLEPPSEPELIHFRDPFVWGSPGDWSMVVGAGLRRGRGAVLHYRSPDLENWHFRGVLAAGDDGDQLGETWECPQYVDLGGGDRALVVSVWDGGRLTRVVATRGVERDGSFVPGGSWGTLGYGGAAYALTTYRDRAGRLAATAWLRHEIAEPRAGWSGMLSLPLVLSAGADGGVHVAPHPDVDTLRREALDCTGGTVDLAGGGAADGVAELAVTLSPGAGLRLESADRPVLITAAGAALVVESAGGSTSVPVTAGAPAALRVVVDRGAVEAWTGDGRWIALRIPFLRVRRAVLGGSGRLSAHRLEPVQAT